MAQRIDDASDDRLVDYRALRDVKARRHIEGDEFFVAEGPVAIERLVASGHRIRSVVVSDRKYERMQHLLDSLDAPVHVLDRDVLHDLVGFDLHRGAIAAADRRRLASVSELTRSCDRIAVLEGLNDPENLGAIARSARAFGIDGLLLDPTCIDPYTRRTVRVSMGEILMLPFARAETWPDTLDELHASGIETWALTPAGDADALWTLEPPHRLAIVLGAEGPGLDARTIRGSTRPVRIPIDPDVDSLNVGAAAAVAFASIATSRGR